MFHHAIDRALPSENVKERVENLIDSITYSVFMYTSRGLFERDKLTFVSQVAFQVSASTTVYTRVKLTTLCIKHCGQVLVGQFVCIIYMYM